MAEAEIAFVAAAGAAGLALSISAWAWRLRRRVAAQEAAAERRAALQAAGLSERDGALSAFDDVRIGLTPDGAISALLGAPAAVQAARAAVAPATDAASLDDGQALLS
ncbi:MAG: two-component sensor histidine kinase, partial [Brevundimonas sp.]